MNNASVTVGSGGNVNLEDIYLFGASTLSVGGITLTAAASALSDNTIEAVLVGISDTNYSYPFIDGTLSGELTIAQAKVASGQTLTIPLDATLTVAQKLEVTDGGTLAIGGGGQLNMIGESEFVMNGTLSPEQDAQLRFGPNAVVSGVTLYDETAEQTITYDGNNGDHDIFIWLETIGDPAIECNKWVRFIDGGGDPGEFTANEFSVDYDSWNSSAFVEVAGNVVQAYTPTVFTENITLEFTLEPPQDRVDDTPIVEIEVDDGTLWRSDFDVGNEHKLLVTNNAFSFTPTTAYGFIVRVWWSEFDLFYPDDEHFMVFTNCDEYGEITLSPEVTAGDSISHGNQSKYLYSNGTEVTATFTPNTGKVLVEVFIGETLYCDNPGSGGHNLSELENGYAFTGGGEREIYIEAHFADEQVDDPGDPGTPAPNQFQIVGEQPFAIDSQNTNQLSFNNGSVSVAYGQSNTPAVLVMDGNGGDRTDWFDVGSETSVKLTFNPNSGYLPKVYIDGLEQTFTGNEFTYTLQEDETYKSISVGFVEDKLSIVFVDSFGNSWTYEDYKTNTECAAMATIQYSYDDITWYEFTTQQVDADENLSYELVTEDSPEKKVYSFDESPVYLKVTAVSGAIINELLNNVGDEYHAEPGPLTLNQAYTLTTGHTYNLLRDNGYRNIWWDGTQGVSDMRLENGGVKIISATLNNENAIKENISNQAEDGTVGYVWIKPGATVTIQLIPDYGYQLNAFSLNGFPLVAQQAVSTFSFEMAGTHLHLSAIFAAYDDEVSETAEGVSGGNITGGEDVIDSGNLRLSVADSAMDGDERTAMESSTAAENVDLINYLAVDLEQFLKKGSGGEEWVTALEELSDEVTIVLNVGTDLDETKTYVVVREHNDVYEQIQAVYDKAAGTLTFSSDKFSDYAIGTLTDEGDPDVPTYTPTYTPPVEKPAEKPVEIPATGDANVEVEVTVSGSEVTVSGIPASEIEKVGDEPVSLDFSNLSKPVDEVKLPASAIEDIADSKADGLEIALSTGTVSFDDAAVDAISETATGEDIVLNVEVIDKKDLTAEQKSSVEGLGEAVIIKATLTSGGVPISDFKGGSATVEVPYEMKNNGKLPVVYFLDDDGKLTKMGTTYDPVTKTVKFTTPHFSEYIIAELIPIPFTDVVEKEWYADNVRYVYEKGMMEGIGNNLFNPSGTTSRAMIVTILYRLEGEPVMGQGKSGAFADVPENTWYTDAVEWAAAKGIVEGYNGKFNPNNPITREQLAAILWRYAKYKGMDVSVGENTNILSYNDAFDVAEYALPAMQWACGTGIIQGSDGNLMPDGTAKRCEAAAMLQRYCELPKN